VTNKSDWFVEYVQDMPRLDTMTFGDGREHYVEGRGHVQIKLKFKTLMFMNALHSWIKQEFAFN
jgi:hypothetical protein